MAVRSRRLFGPIRIGVAAAATALYTCPAGRTALLKSLVLVGPSAANGTYFVLLNGVSGATNALVPSSALGQNGRVVYEEGWTLNPGDVLYGFVQTANTYIWTGFGAELFGAPA